ncbi:MAG: HDOD domain-containing protein [Granulosicoccaceae bacterium]
MEALLENEHFPLREFGGLSALSDENIQRVGEAIRPLNLPEGTELHANLEQGWLIYLIEGELTLVNQLGEKSEIIEANSARALAPIFTEGCYDIHVRAPQGAQLIRIDRLHVEVLLARQLSESTQVAEIGFEGADTEVFASIFDAHEAGALKVPSLPEVATAVNEAARDNDMDFNRLAAIVQRDPPCTARLIQVANSPAYRGAVEVQTLSSAISRMGLDGSRNMVIAIAVEQLVNDVHPRAMECLRDFYHESAEVGALCFVLAQKMGGMREERAYMAGLLHGLGMVPIINHAYAVLSPEPDIDLVKRVGEHLVQPLSSWLLSEWGLDAALCDAAESATDWYRPVGEDVGVVEFVIVAKLLRLVAQGQPTPAEIASTDIGKCLIEAGVDLTDPVAFLNMHQEDLDSARQLLG